MPLIEHKQFIKAPIDSCFELARDVGVHTQPILKTKGKAVGGVTKGLLVEGNSVTWESVHYGIKLRVTTRVIFMENPYSFVEKMVKGPFRYSIHIHQFIEEEAGTIMIDHFQYKSRFSLIGVLIDKLFLAKYIEKLIEARAIEFKKIVETKTNQTFD
ncbi:cell division protein [Neobacillus sp. NPDC093182]|uniref:SRPBCC family protein n=1 Tax=Neobacillus sp. NPDC093182 TaxID=3364297 RepID=UPI00380C4D79